MDEGQTAVLSALLKYPSFSGATTMPIFLTFNQIRYSIQKYTQTVGMLYEQMFLS